MTDSQKWLLLAGLLGSGWLIYLLAPILTPFAIGALLAYLGDPVADRLESWKMSRTAAVCVVFVGMVLLLAAVLLLLIPLLERQVSHLLSSLPGYVQWLKQVVLPWLNQKFQIRPEALQLEALIKMFKDHWQQAGGLATAIMGSISRSGIAVAEWLMNLTLIPVVAFYLLRDWDLLVDNTANLLPKRLESRITKLVKEADLVLGAFFRGQFSVMIALGVIYSIGLWIVGLDLALLIGMVAGLISFIPYLGSIFGVVAACVAAIAQFQDIWSLIPILVVFAVGQTLEGMVLTPWLVGDKVGLHPVAVIFAILAGGQLFGFVGVLIALPAASVIMVLMRHIHDIYKDSDLYRQQETAESQTLPDLPERYPEEDGLPTSNPERV